MAVARYRMICLVFYVNMNAKCKSHIKTIRERLYLMQSRFFTS